MPPENPYAAPQVEDGPQLASPPWPANSQERPPDVLSRLKKFVGLCLWANLLLTVSALFILTVPFGVFGNCMLLLFGFLNWQIHRGMTWQYCLLWSILGTRFLAVYLGMWSFPMVIVWLENFKYSAPFLPQWNTPLDFHATVGLTILGSSVILEFLWWAWFAGGILPEYRNFLRMFQAWGFCVGLTYLLLMSHGISWRNSAMMPLILTAVTCLACGFSSISILILMSNKLSSLDPPCRTTNTQSNNPIT